MLGILHEQSRITAILCSEIMAQTRARMLETIRDFRRMLSIQSATALTEEPHEPRPQIALELEPMALPAGESALRAAYVRLELSRFFDFEQAMSDPAYQTGITKLADAMARRESAERIADIFANHQPNCRL